MCVRGGHRRGERWWGGGGGGGEIERAEAKYMYKC